MCEDMLSFYHGNEPGGIPGMLPKPYYCARPVFFIFIFFLLFSSLGMVTHAHFLQGGKLAP